MNDASLDRVLAGWLRAHAPARAPAEILDGALAAVEVIPQQRGLLGRELPRLRARPAWVPLAILLALLVAALLAAYLLVGGGGPSPKPAIAGYLAFVGVGQPGESRSPPSADIYVVRADGSGLRNVTNSPAFIETAPVWSPDGSRLAFARRTAGAGITEPGSVVIVDVVAGRMERTVSMAEGLSPWLLGWSPDGRTVAVYNMPTGLPGDRISFVVASTGAVERLPVDAKAPVRWSPDGAWLLVTTNDMFLVPADKVGADLRDPANVPGVRRLTADARDESYPPPVWAPDGSAIAYASLGNQGMNLPAANVIDLRTGAQSVVAAGGFSPAWSPDSRRIAYLQLGGSVWIVDRDGSHRTKIATSFIPPKWSPDGTALVLLDAGGLYTVAPDGTGLMRLTPTSMAPEPSAVHWLELLEQAGGSNGCCGDFGPDWNPVLP
jgi:dipeptidyl aminopeptidase/acylaminoacyl peptidase